MQHALKHVKKKYGIFEYVQYIFPTNPLRNEKDIIRGYKVLIRNNVDLVISVSESKKCGFTINKIDKNHSLKNFVPKKYRKPNRQEFPKTYFIDGSIYIGKWDVWFKKKDWFTVKSKAIITPQERFIDIDDDEDFELAKYKLKKIKR